MKTRRYQWLKQLWDLPRRPNRFLTLFMVTAIITLALDLGVKASEVSDASQSGSGSDYRLSPGLQNSETAGSGLAEAPGEALSDYRLSPGDQIKLVVLDHPQLSGDFIVDGGGGILLPIAGNVQLSGLTLAEAQNVIHDRFADGVLVQPAVSLRITKYKPIFVTGSVRKPGSYAFNLGETVKAAIAAAGGEGQPLEQPGNVTISDFITAQERVRQLEAERIILLMRKARLETQRDGRENFVMPLLVGLNRDNTDFDLAYSTENEMFSKLEEAYRSQVEALQRQRPLVEAEIKAVVDQIAKQKERLGIVTSHLDDLQLLFRKGLLRKEVLLQQQIEKSLVEAQASNLAAQVAHLRQAMGELDLKLRQVKAAYEKQTMGELQQVSQRLRAVETSIGPARNILVVKAEAVGGYADDDPEYTMLISGMRDSRMVTFEATDSTTLLPGDVVDVKLKQRKSGDTPAIQAMRSLSSISSVAEDREPSSR